MQKIVRLTTEAISMRLMDEKFHAKMLISIIAANEQSMITRGRSFLCIFLIIVMAASSISMPTATLIPLNALAMIVISRK